MRDLRSIHTSVNEDLGRRLLQTIENKTGENAPDSTPSSVKEQKKVVNKQVFITYKNKPYVTFIGVYAFKILGLN